ncbi:ThiF family protein [Phlyctema vagabunda]|uniref:Adenylyltransferase and sulfurtransferase uba4 n=1 Tax=Phlyctema vagabunda TaxID=108571 RepID=A0ABR4P3R0_9HELO
MSSATSSLARLRIQIQETEEQLKTLKVQLAELEAQESTLQASHDQSSKWPLSTDEYKRYGRQMIVPNFGIQGQQHLKSSSVLIIGAGGLGCPAAAYLAGAGIGHIGIVDGDTVELSNLHRQILHSTSKVGVNKVDSAISYLKGLNSSIKYTSHPTHLTPQNAESIVKDYDIVLDCTDHPTSRYLISDICVLLRKPLVSASALRTDGQLLLLNDPPLPPGPSDGENGSSGGGPCYRCIFPRPPPAASVVSCGDGGILGPVVGVMGVLQALETIRYISSGRLNVAASSSASGVGGEEKDKGASMLLFSATNSPPFRSVKIRSKRRPQCFACSGGGGGGAVRGEENTDVPPQLTLEALKDGSIDYALFCGLTHPVSILSDDERISATAYHAQLHPPSATTTSSGAPIQPQPQPHLLLDVREKIQFDICALPGAVNVPFSRFQNLLHRPVSAETTRPALLDDVIPAGLPSDAPIYVVCRLGNDSQVVTRKLKELGVDAGGQRWVGDLRGGLRAWRDEVDREWPDY